MVAFSVQDHCGEQTMLTSVSLVTMDDKYATALARSEEPVRFWLISTIFASYGQREAGNFTPKIKLDAKLSHKSFFCVI